MCKIKEIRLLSKKLKQGDTNKFLQCCDIDKNVIWLRKHISIKQMSKKRALESVLS